MNDEVVRLDLGGVAYWLRELDDDHAILYTRDSDMKNSIVNANSKYVDVLVGDDDGDNLMIASIDRNHCMIVNIPGALGGIVLTSRNGRKYYLY